jgi:phage-related protein
MADIPFSLELVMGVKETTTHRVRKFGFGDGYEQIAPDGINTKVREYNITTRPFNLVETNAFKANLDEVCAGDFFLVPNTSGLPPYIIGESVRFRIADNKYSISNLPASEKYIFEFTLREAFSG